MPEPVSSVLVAAALPCRAPCPTWVSIPRRMTAVPCRRRRRSRTDQDRSPCSCLSMALAPFGAISKAPSSVFPLKLATLHWPWPTLKTRVPPLAAVIAFLIAATLSLTTLLPGAACTCTPGLAFDRLIRPDLRMRLQLRQDDHLGRRYGDSEGKHRAKRAALAREHFHISAAIVILPTMSGSASV